MSKVCVFCGKIYNPLKETQTTCSLSCRSKNIRKTTVFNYVCIQCGKPYISKATNSLYCSKRCKLDSIRWKPITEKCSWCGVEYQKIKGAECCSKHCKQQKKQSVRKNRMQNSIDLRLMAYLRHYLFRAVKGKQYSSRFYLGYNVLELKQSLESKFLEGMSWDNYGEWHIDHIRPLISFNFYNEDGTENVDMVKKAMSLSNLQPLWAHDNIRKGGKYPQQMEA